MHISFEYEYDNTVKIDRHSDISKISTLNNEIYYAYNISIIIYITIITSIINIIIIMATSYIIVIIKVRYTIAIIME